MEECGKRRERFRGWYEREDLVGRGAGRREEKREVSVTFKKFKNEEKLRTGVLRSHTKFSRRYTFYLYHSIS